MKSVVTIHAKSGIPENDYRKNSFFDNADTRRVYRFDAQTKLLEAVQVYLVRPSGEVLIFDLSQIDYNQPIDPSVWKLELPADVSWSQEPQKLPDNEKYASMTAEQAARAFFEACAREDWNEAGKFMSPITEGVKQYLRRPGNRQPGRVLYFQGLWRPVCALRNQTSTAGVQYARVQRQPGETVRGHRNV